LFLNISFRIKFSIRSSRNRSWSYH